MDAGYRLYQFRRRLYTVYSLQRCSCRGAGSAGGMPQDCSLIPASASACLGLDVTVSALHFLLLSRVLKRCLDCELQVLYVFLVITAVAPVQIMPLQKHTRPVDHTHCGPQSHRCTICVILLLEYCTESERQPIELFVASCMQHVIAVRGCFTADRDAARHARVLVGRGSRET